MIQRKMIRMKYLFKQQNIQDKNLENDISSLKSLEMAPVFLKYWMWNCFFLN